MFVEARSPCRSNIAIFFALFIFAIPMKFNPIGFKFLGFFLLFASIALPSYAYAEARRRSLEELYNLCSVSPLNSLCAGYQTPDPIPLEMQSGKYSGCFFAGGSRFRSGACKVSFVDESLLVYIESEETLSAEDSQSGTVEIKIPVDRILFNHQKSYFLRSDEPGNSNSYAFTTNQISFSIEQNAYFENQTGFINIVSNGPIPFAERIIGNPDRAQFSLVDWNDESAENSGITPSQEEIEVNRDRLLETGICVRCNLQGVDLEGVKLEGVNLEGANLKDANLRKSKLKEAYLVGANLEGADLEDAELNEAFLLFASLDRSNSIDTNFSGAQLQYTQFSEANLSKAEFIAPANLEFANFENANLSRSRFSGVYLTGATFQGANLEKAKLSYHNIRLVNIWNDPPHILRPFERLLSHPTIISFQANFSNINFRSANLTDANIEDAIMRNADLREANLMGTKLEEAILTGANLCGAMLPDGSRSQQGCP